MTERCACCERPLTPFRFGGWCELCVNGLLVDAGMLGTGDADEVTMTAAWLYDHGCLTLARYVTHVPFIMNEHNNDE